MNLLDRESYADVDTCRLERVGLRVNLADLKGALVDPEQAGAGCDFSSRPWAATSAAR